MGDNPTDRVEPEAGEELIVADPVKVLLKEVGHHVVGCNGEAVGPLPLEGGEKTLLWYHVSIYGAWNLRASDGDPVASRKVPLDGEWTSFSTFRIFHVLSVLHFNEGGTLMKYAGIVLIALLLLVALAPTAQAQSKPVQLALVNPIQIFPENTSIAGVRLSLIYGKNTSVSGIDWGLVNHTTSGTSLGWHASLVGMNGGNFVGLQQSFVGLVDGNAEGVQMGFYNHAGHMSGVQFGFINHAGTMKGLQIGLINIIKSGGQFPVFPIVNWSF
jgi:hypothetical protein